MRRAEPKHVRYDSKKGRTDSVNGKDRVKIQKDQLNPKNPTTTRSKHGRSGLKNPREVLTQNTEGQIQKYGSSNSEKEGLVDTSQPSYMAQSER